MTLGTETDNVQWRAGGSYKAINASKTGLVDETALYLTTYLRTHDIAAAKTELVSSALPQKSRVGREIIVRVIQERLVHWHPPHWVLNDLAVFATSYDSTALLAALLLHTVRQDRLLSDFVQDVIVPRWRDGDHLVIRSDVQRYLDKAAVSDHPEINRWSAETREKLAGNVLSILRDYGLLSGKQKKHIVEPTVPAPVVAHLVHLLEAEGISPDDMPYHPDWRIWLMDPPRVKTLLLAASTHEPTTVGVYEGVND